MGDFTKYDNDFGGIEYVNYYRCPICGEEWEDVWESMCNDHCPGCDAEIEPYESEKIV